MAQAAWNRNGIQRLQNGIRQGLDDLQDLRQEADTIGSETMTEMQLNIATRGTAKSGKTGRIDTGTMIDAVDYKVTGDDTMVNVSVGWIRAIIDYFRFQEYGFRHYLSGEFIEPMFAMRDANTTAREKFREANARVLRKVADSIRRG